MTIEASHGLTSEEVLRAWELGARLHPVDRALLLCAFAAPELARTALASLPVGHRDALLLSLRSRTFGDKLDAVLDCPHCEQGLELSIAVTSLRVEDPDIEARCIVGDREIALRKLDSRDLAAIASAGDAAAARKLLVERAIVGAVPELTEDERTAIATRLGELDPQADLVFDLTCTECRATFRTTFDIASFLWNEVSVEARRLIQDVATLARAFKWSEADILGMSAVRRQRYLELAEA